MVRKKSLNVPNSEPFQQLPILSVEIDWHQNFLHAEFERLNGFEKGKHLKRVLQSKGFFSWFYVWRSSLIVHLMLESLWFIKLRYFLDEIYFHKVGNREVTLFNLIFHPIESLIVAFFN